MITLRTDHPIAETSLDHTHPRGSALDNTKNPRFVSKLLSIRSIGSLLDIGCAGGGSVSEFIDAGVPVVIGLEGSDYSLKTGRAEWPKIPNNLFTCDVTNPFTLYNGKKIQKFEIVTAWEFFEHISEEDLPGLMDNLRNHTQGDSWIFCSICPSSDVWEGNEYHQTQKPLEWWVEFFRVHGWIPSPIQAHFKVGEHDGEWVRYSTGLVLERV